MKLSHLLYFSLAGLFGLVSQSAHGRTYAFTEDANGTVSVTPKPANGCDPFGTEKCGINVVLLNAWGGNNVDAVYKLTEPAGKETEEHEGTLQGSDLVRFKIDKNSKQLKITVFSDGALDVPTFGNTAFYGTAEEKQNGNDIPLPQNFGQEVAGGQASLLEVTVKSDVPIPEPSSLLLLACGVAAVAFKMARSLKA
jgi:hypothetical protein